MSRSKLFFSALFLLLISLLYVGKPALAAEETTIYKGVFIDQVNVSGMTKEQAKAAVEDFINELRSKNIAISVGDYVVHKSLGELGYTGDVNEEVTQALKLGRAGNLVKRYKDIKDIEEGSVTIPLKFSYDKEKIKDMIANDVSKFNTKPINASVAKENGKLVYTNHVVGSKVNVDETVNLITAKLDEWDRNEISLQAKQEEDQPVYTRDIVEKCNTLLGSFTTEYASSAQGRAANLANGARLINNLVLYPGDIFSAYDILTPFTEANGYYVAGAYLNGEVIDSVGGGACQVTTTLYNAVLMAELEVVQRQPHSMTISYVDLSRDAAIAGTYKNFRFKNNTDVPILIEAYTINRKITFKLWGNETRDTKNRTIKYVTKVLSTKNPPADIITKDPTKPTTYQEVTTPAHTGYKAELYKVEYVNGKEVKRSLVNRSTYQAAAKRITVGTKEVQVTPTTAPVPPANTQAPVNPGDTTGTQNPPVQTQ